MVREEAINKLNWALDNNTIEDVQSAYEYILALKMAIKALEQEPTPKNDIGVDCISREAVERIINKWLSHYDYELKDHIYSMTEKIHNLPSVTPLSSELEKNSKKLEKNFGLLDCISREQALVAIRNLYPGMPRVDFNGSLRKWADKYKPYIECEDAIEQLPSVTPQEPRIGHWIETAEEYYKAINEKGGGVNEDTDYFTDDIACSECLAKFSVIENEAERFDFCPCCGADMR